MGLISKFFGQLFYVMFTTEEVRSARRATELMEQTKKMEEQNALMKKQIKLMEQQIKEKQ